MEKENLSDEFYKKICNQYINTMDKEIILEDNENNQIIHAVLTDEAIDLINDNKINLDNFDDYLEFGEGMYDKYNTYKNMYEAFVEDNIRYDIEDLGLFNGKDDKYDFYISKEDMITLGFEDEIKDQEKENNLENWINQELSTSKDDNQDIIMDKQEALKILDFGFELRNDIQKTYKNILDNESNLTELNNLASEITIPLTLVNLRLDEVEKIRNLPETELIKINKNDYFEYVESINAIYSEIKSNKYCPYESNNENFEEDEEEEM